ncbi:MAG: YwiC-like family protein [Nitrospinota bacterium]|nr:YwiC-like family protein [Nitrospinota bacterium]
MNKPVIPKEHGAWPVLIVPMIAGSLAVAPDPSFSPGAMAALIISAVSGFLTVSALRMALNPPPKANMRRLVTWTCLYSALSMGPFAWLVLGAGKGGLLWFIIPAALLTSAYFWSTSAGIKRSLPFELAGLAGLTLSGPAAAYLQQGYVPADGALIYIFCLVWFTDRTLTARKTLELMRKQGWPSGARDRLRLFSFEYGAHAIGIAIAALVIVFSGREGGWTMIIPLLAATAKNAWDTLVLAAPTDPMKVGFSEMRLGIGFCALFVLVWKL